MHFGSSIPAQAEGLARAGRPQEAVRLLERSAAADDPSALITLAIWRVDGRWAPRDLQLAKQLFGKAAEAGNQDAAHVQAAFVAHGAGGEPDWEAGLMLLARLSETDANAARQWALIQSMALTRTGDPVAVPKAEQISSSPDVWRLPALFTADECAFLIDTTAARMERALVIERASGREYQAPVRTAQTAAFPLIFENPAIHALNRRLAAASGTSVEQGEPLQVLRYDPGQEYRPHFDALAPGGNQRVLTLLVYLNEAYEGGETHFLESDLKFKGRSGDGLLFRNAHADGRPDPSSRHAGLPVTRGAKLIASRWIRAKPIDLMKPLT